MSDATCVDPHVKVLDEDLVERAVRSGLDAVVYAPHFTRWPEIERRAAELSTEELLVVPGREIFTGGYKNRKHVLALDLEHPVPDFVTLEATMSELDRQGATVLAPHPEYLTVGLTGPDLRAYRDTVDAVEVYNPKYWPHHVRRSRSLAEDLELPAFGSSYAHLAGTLGDVWTEFDGSIDDEASLCSALAETDQRVCRRSGIGPRLRGAVEFAHLGWENSWRKFDRVVLSGTEPTHPHHEAYEGRFDDAFVY